jgi:hemerythrin-like metal-binding protein
MRIIQWQESYKVGHDTIDNQHRKLVTMIGELQRSLDNGHSYEVMSETLKELVDYTQYHFRDEEKIMQEIGHQGIDYHKYLHRQMLEQVVQILSDLKQGKQYTPQDLISYLTNWLTEHIVAEDGKIGHSLRNKQRAKAPA